MKVLHLCLASFYIDNYSYQENLLPKYHKKLGFDVEIIASLVSFNQDGNLTILDSGYSEYINENNIHVTRLEYKTGRLNKRLRRYNCTLDRIEKANPDIIFIHGCQFLDIIEVVKYLKNHPYVKAYVDNHADFSNSASNWISKNILHKIIWRYCANRILPFTNKYFGVLPNRVKFLEDVYKLPEEKLELLIMGVDDDLLNNSDNNDQIKKIRVKYGIHDTDFLIVTGGKFNNEKKHILNLLEAVKEIKNPRIKLIVFGTIETSFMNQVEKYFDNINIIFVGWLNNEDSYIHFLASDLVVFPGSHSVYWEQVVGLGKPLIVKNWEEPKHLDIGGNCIILKDGGKEEIKEKIEYLSDNPNAFMKMKSAANSPLKNSFLYSNIAKQSLELNHESIIRN